MKYATTLTVSSLMTAVLMFPCQATAGEELQAHYMMVVVGNHASSDLVSRGDYKLAVHRITVGYNVNPFATATNLCVALSMLGQINQAEPRCDEAIRLAEKSPTPAPKGWKGRNQLAKQRAIAYSNRGVMNLMRGNASEAEEDFRTAIEYKAKLRAPAQNLARAQVETTGKVVAKVSY